MRRKKRAGDEPWYAARCLFEHPEQAPRKGTRCYEERVVVLRARGFGEAIRRGESEAKRYARGCLAEYLGFIEVFHLFEEALGDGAEVWSIMRSKRMSRARFERAYYDDGSFRRGALRRHR
jgi:hypothetical protein